MANYFLKQQFFWPWNFVARKIYQQENFYGRSIVRLKQEGRRRRKKNIHTHTLGRVPKLFFVFTFFYPFVSFTYLVLLLTPTPNGLFSSFFALYPPFSFSLSLYLFLFIPSQLTLIPSLSFFSLSLLLFFSPVFFSLTLFSPSCLSQSFFLSFVEQPHQDGTHYQLNNFGGPFFSSLFFLILTGVGTWVRKTLIKK